MSKVSEDLKDVLLDAYNQAYNHAIDDVIEALKMGQKDGINNPQIDALIIALPTMKLKTKNHE